MKQAIKIVTYVLLVWCGLGASYSWAALQASVSQNPVYVGEIFTLEVASDKSLDPDELSTKELEASFDVFRPSVSRQKSYVNGTLTSSTRWTISLLAKQAGQVIIPPLTIAGETTQPIKLTVLDEKQQANHQQADDVWMESSVSHNQVYVGQQLIYTVDLYIGAMLENANLQAPSLTGAQVVQLGSDEKQMVVKNGVKYQKITRKFAITPKQAGDVTITGARLTGELYKTVATNGFRSRTVRQVVDINSGDVTLKVKAKPSEIKDKDWLVSSEVLLSEQLQDDAVNLTVGQPITRTFTLIATNTGEQALPKIAFNYPASVRIYPDKDEVSSFIHQGTAFAQRISSHAIIAEQAGELVLPEVSVPWWNSETDKLEYAIVPARTIQVLPNPNASETPIPSVQPTTTQGSSPGFWPYTTLLFALLWLATLALWLYQRHGQGINAATQSAKGKSAKRHAHIDNVDKALVVAVKTNDPRQAWQALQPWAQHHWPNINGVSQLPVSAELQLAIQELELCIAKNQPWQNQAMLAALKQSKQRSASATLPPMNPT
ncbi:BatD family protein [Motilimonas eburnea]|uniref:BatD family protein n=1 Tax=Motilimonas eburnea TaxID=1737488 RepID=UPI001E379351|nr:BatD family protein [Motilimonas eburnea]